MIFTFSYMLVIILIRHIYLIYCDGAHYVEIWIIVTLSDHNICKNITQIHDIKIVSPDDKSTQFIKIQNHRKTN